jgi:hypothetical protein
MTQTTKAPPALAPPLPVTRRPRRRARGLVSVLLTVLGALLVWLALTMPSTLAGIEPATFLRLPLEALVFVALALVVPWRAMRVVATLLGVLLALLTILRVLDIGFFESLNRAFNPLVDWRYAKSAISLLHQSVGYRTATLIQIGIVVLVVALLTLLPLALLRLGRLVSRHRSASLRGLVAVAVVWALLAALDVQLVGGTPEATTSASTYAYGQVSRVPPEIRDQHAFAQATKHDPLQNVPASRLLTGLRGKDVIFAFVESYGRVAVQDSSFSPGVDKVLRSGTRRLRADGYSTRSAFLTSPTFGAISWLAHSTFQTGLWADSQQRYDSLVASNRMTLSTTFKRAGWRVVGDVPANTHDWPQASSFYHYDKLYDSRNVGYRGPRFGYPTMPDQYTLSALHRLELAKAHRKPVMAEVDLVSSHAPWSRTPRPIPWSKVGDGSAYDGMPQTLPSEGDIWPSPTRVKAAYGNSIEYSVGSLISYVQHYGNKNTVLVLMGDHQPATIVTGPNASHDVPITVVAKDPAVMRRISGWGWQSGMLPSPNAPVWRMDSFRDRFLSAFGP